MAESASARTMSSSSRWLRFSLRGLIVVVTAGCLMLGWLADRAQRQRRALAALEAAGGSASFADEASSAATASAQAAASGRGGMPAAAWLGWLPSEYLRRVTEVRLIGSPARDFSFLADLPDLERVYLIACPQFEDEDLRHMSGLRRLEVLNLLGAKIQGDGLEYLAGLPRLQILMLRDTEIDDRAVAPLAALDGLRELDVFNTRLTRQSIAQLQSALPECQLFQRP